jgi:hypothetical protein
MVALIFLAGVGTATFRHLNYRIPILPGAQQTVWQVEARIDYLVDSGSSQIFLTLPPEQSGFRVVSETGASPGFGFDIERTGDQRRAHWTKRYAEGAQTLFYELELVQDAMAAVTAVEPEVVSRPRWDEPYRTAAQQLLDSVIPITADAHSLAIQLIKNLSRKPPDQNVTLLRGRYDDPELVANLIATAGVPARVVQVLRLEDGRRRQPLSAYVQVWHEDGWHLYDPASGRVGESDDLLIWQTDTPALLEVIGGSRSRVSFSMINQSRPMLALIDQQSPGYDISLYSLPIAEQGMFKLIMLLPVGALVVVFMRLIVGIRTAGTFMPVLIALAFLQTELLPGLASFILIISIGLIIRAYLSDLNLLLVARIATLIILVIGIISVFSVISYRLGLIGGLTITFFPMIILAWTIERMSIIWEEEGPKEVFIQGAGSLTVAVLAYLVMDLPLVRHLAFNFPELHFCVLAFVLAIGRYTGYRLVELNRFSGLFESDSARVKDPDES